MATRFDLQNGMTVLSSDGEKLGKIVSYDANSFIVEKGFFFPKEYEFQSADITDIRGDEVILRHAKDYLLGGQSWAKEDTTTNVGTAHLGGAKATTTTAATSTLGRNEEVRVPLAEEQLNVRKDVQQAGSVRIHKEVVTEQKTVTVPVTREVVRVERVPASSEARASASGSMFREETIEVPLHEERAIIDKDVVVREELRVTKDSVTENATATETLRRETAEVREEGDVVRQEGAIDRNLPGYSQDRLDTSLDDGRFQQGGAGYNQGSGIGNAGINGNVDDPLKRKL